MICDLSKSFYLLIILSKLCSVYICDAFNKFDSVVLIESDLAIVLNKSHYWTWNITRGEISKSRQIATDFVTPIEFIWIPYSVRHSNISEPFELDYGKICIRSSDSSLLFNVTFDQTSKSIKIEKSSSDYCDRHILIPNNSSCATTIPPFVQSDLNLLNDYSGTFLVGGGQYSYIIFDRKYKSADTKSQQIIISIKLLDVTARLTPHLCLQNLENLISPNKITTKTLTGLKTIMQSDGINIYIFFDNQYCIANIGHYSDCHKRSYPSSETRSKRESNSNSTKDRTLHIERQTYPTSTNDYRSGIAIFIILVISIIIIAAYKLILIT